MEAELAQSMETALQDLRYAFRALRKAPGFSAIVILTLATGIGASLTMFSLMRGVLWRPLPYPEPERIVVIHVDARNVSDAGATALEFLGIRNGSRSFERVATLEAPEASLEYAGRVDDVPAVSISDDFLPLLGVQPALGRLLDSSTDSSADRSLAVLIGDDLWRRRFGADPGVIGRAVRVNGVSMQIAGVLPPDVRLYLPPSVSHLEQADLWLPNRINPATPYRGIPLMARLRPGVTLAQANAELQALAARFEREYPDAYAGARAWQASPLDRASGSVRFRARGLHEEMTRDIRPALFLLAGAVTFVLLIACLNAANLMLARGTARQREIEIRRALGAGTSHVVRQLLAECLSLAAVSGVLGLLGARFGIEAIFRLGQSQVPLQSRIAIDAPVALFALALAAVTTVLFGLLPAWRLASDRTGQALRAGRAETTRAGSRRMQRALVVAEVALSIAPLAGAGLMLRSFVNLMQAPLGFEPDGVITARLPLDSERRPKLEQRWAYLRSIVDPLRASPGVLAVSAADPIPFMNQARRRVGRPDQPDSPPMLATQQFALPGYLQAIGTPLLAGRDFSDADIREQRKVTIIDAGLAKRLWPEGAVGKHLSVYRTGWRHDLEVIGVAGSARMTRLRDESIPSFMLPFADYPSAMFLVVRTDGQGERAASLIRSAVAAADGDRSPIEIRAMRSYIAESAGDTRFILFVLTMFATASALLAGVGLYGTLAYLTAQRTREFGIRLALGSSVSALIAIVMRESFSLVAVGAAIGLIGVVAGARIIRELLYGVQPLDGITLVGVTLLLGIIALIAAGVPALRTTRIDPQTSLRSE